MLDSKNVEIPFSTILFGSLLSKLPLPMRKIIYLLIFAFPVAFLAGCAEKQEPFDPVAVFNSAEEHMRKESFENARKEYQEIQEKSPDKSYDAALMLRIADTYFGEEKYEEALVEYRAFLNFHPVNKDAVYAQYQIAMCSFKQVSTIDRDPEPTRIALREFRILLEKYPNSAYQEQAAKNISICLDRLSEYELYVGNFYYKKRAYKAAIGRLDALLRDYPGSSAEKDALYYLGLALTELGDKARAMAVLETLMKKYPSMQASAKLVLDRLTSQ